MYLPIYIKTDYSLQSSMIKIDDLILAAKKYNYTSLALTDNNLFGAMEFYTKCLQNNIKPIIGLELNYKKNIILYAKNYKGYKNLIKLSSNEVDYDYLKKHSSDLICILPFSSKDLYNELKDIFKELFLGYKNEDEYNLIKGNLIYLNEILYLNKEDSKYINYLYAIKNGELLENVITSKNNNCLLEEKEYLLIDKTINNNKYIYENCNLVIEKEKNLLPIYECPNNDSYSYLKKLCLIGIKNKFGNVINKTYQDRLKYELDVINKMGFCNYFLIVHDYVNYAKKNNILVGPARGSAAGSLVSYVLNITDIDPIKYNLIFERFLNPERITMPDIDIDFEFNKRDEVINYCVKKYGIEKVSGIITFGTFGAKQALRDVGKIMDVNINKIDLLSKLIDSNLTLKENLEKNKKISNLLEDKEILNVYKSASKIEGLKKHTSSHAAGIVMSNLPLEETVPVIKKDNMYLSGYSMEYLEELGLLKMDFLALKTLTLITDIINMINKDNVNLTFDNIPLQDEATFSIFETGNTLGIFQFESNGMIDFIKRFKPNNLEDIFACIALYRPGPMDNIESYIKRKNGEESIDYIIPDLEPILSPTYGIIVYQEQIMQISSLLASYTLGEADILRRAISKKKESVLLNEKENFIKRSVSNGYNEEDATKVIDLIIKFASYGFNRAHSVGYAIISYKMAYLKANYPKQFMACLLNNSIGSSIDTSIYINDCKLNNINILIPSINRSTKEYEIDNDSIIFPLTNIKNINSNVVDHIISIRKNKFNDIFDFVKKSDKKIITKKVLETLILSGCFIEFNINKKTLINKIDIIINYGDLTKGMDETYSLKPIIEEEEEYSKVELSSIEIECFGFYLTNHPVNIYKSKYKNIIESKDIKQYFDKIIDIIVLVDRKNEIDTKKKDKMCFISGSDEASSLDFVLFPETYKNATFEKGDVVLIRGKVEKRFDKYQIIVSNLKVLV